MAVLLLWASWVVLACSLAGWGILVRRLLRLGPPVSIADLLGSVWYGFAVVTVALQLWHIFLPVTWLSAVLLLAPGLLVSIREYGRRPWAIKPIYRWAVAHAWVVALLHTLAAWMVLAPPMLPDSGFYYFQAIRWVNEYRLVPGLGNVNIQLGFNNVNFLWSALLNVGPWRGHGYLLLNTFVFVSAITPSYIVFLRWMTGGGPLGPRAMYRIAVLPAFVLVLFDPNYTNPSADYLSWMLSFVVFDSAVGVVVDGRAGRPVPWSSLWTVALLASVLIAVKLSCLVLAVGLVGALVGPLATAYPRRGARAPWALFAAGSLLAALLLLGPWACRNVVLTGYPLYPATMGKVDADWRVPDTKVDAVRRFIKALARHPGLTGMAERRALEFDLAMALVSRDGSQELAGWAENVRPPRRGDWEALWLRAWLGYRPFRSLLRLGLVLALLVALTVLAPGGRRGLRTTAWLALPLLAGLVFWWTQAPSLRFGWGPMLILPAWVFAGLAAHPALRPAWSGWIASVASLGLCLVIFGAGLRDAWRTRVTTGFPVIPEAVTEPRTTLYGLDIRAPRSGRLVYDAPLPATPFFNPHLKLRRPEQGLVGGFVDVPTHPEGSHD